MPKLIIPEKNKIIKTNIEDSGPERYYSNNYFIKKIYRQRLQIALDLVNGNRYNRLLEVGYGNGMLFPTFSKIAKQLYGIDTHGKADEVAKLFDGNFIKASVYKIPFPDNYFDCIFCLSVLEHLENLEQALFEINRVANQNAEIIFGFPDDNFLITLFFYIKKSAALKYHINNPATIIKAIKGHFKIKDKKILKISGVKMYYAYKVGEK